MTENSTQRERHRRFGPSAWRPPTWWQLMLWALAARVVAADVVQWVAQRRGVVCLFPDTGYYWFLATAIVRGEPYEILDFGDLPRFSLRTPGYPLFLAACQWLFGERALPARLAQCLLGAACVWVVGRLAERTVGRGEGRWSLPLITGALLAFEPYLVANSAFLLSEALFVPLLLLSQWGLAEVWTSPDESPRRTMVPALATGAAWGAAVLVRPAWWLFVPLALAVYVAASTTRLRALRATGWMLLGLVVVMAPWWYRNAQIYGRFVPTALWAGASLYDGLNPQATGASDMRFLSDPQFWPLEEEDQDVLLRSRALAFARANPGRVATLALIKAGRFWSPWPNAEGMTSPLIALISALATAPVFALIALGAWERRRDARTLALLLLPLLYTFALHLVFVSSMRYRVPVMAPALVLAAVGFRRITRTAPSPLVGEGWGGGTAEHGG